MNPEMIPGHQNHPERIPAMQYLQKLILLHQDKHRIVTVEADSFACMLCGKHGHLADECSEKKKCHRCKLSDHMKEECPAPISVSDVANLDTLSSAAQIQRYLDAVDV